MKGHYKRNYKRLYTKDHEAVTVIKESNCVSVYPYKFQKATIIPDSSFEEVQQSIGEFTLEDLAIHLNLIRHPGIKKPSAETKELKSKLFFDSKPVCGECDKEMNPTAPDRGSVTPRWRCEQCKFHWSEGFD